MHRLLIADPTGEFGKILTYYLENTFEIQISTNGPQTEELLCTFQPDVFLLDYQMPYMDPAALLYALKTSGSNIKTVVYSNYVGEYVLLQLTELQVCHVFTKPCSLTAVAACLRELSHRLRNPEGICIESEADRLLLALGFRMGKVSYNCTFHALICKCTNPDSSVTKEIYPLVAKQLGGNTKQVEKAIRDAIKQAWDRGSKNLWRLYFPTGDDGELRCPGNDEFLARMAKALHSLPLPKPPYDPK